MSRKERHLNTFNPAGSLCTLKPFTTDNSAYKGFCKQSRPWSDDFMRAAWSGSTLYADGNMTPLILH